MDSKFIIDKLNTKGISTAQIAEALEIDYSTIDKVQKGLTKDPLTSTTRKLENLYRIVFLSCNKS